MLLILFPVEFISDLAYSSLLIGMLNVFLGQLTKDLVLNPFHYLLKLKQLWLQSPNLLFDFFILQFLLVDKLLLSLRDLDEVSVFFLVLSQPIHELLSFLFKDLSVVKGFLNTPNLNLDHLLELLGHFTFYSRRILNWWLVRRGVSLSLRLLVMQLLPSTWKLVVILLHLIR